MICPKSTVSSFASPVENQYIKMRLVLFTVIRCMEIRLIEWNKVRIFFFRKFKNYFKIFFMQLLFLNLQNSHFVDHIFKSLKKNTQ